MTADDGSVAIQVTFEDRRHETLRLTRDGLPAAKGDVDFVAHSREHTRRLIRALHGGRLLSESEIQAIDDRLQHVSPSPWRPFLESEGGLGGDSMIAVPGSDFEPDLYLWLGDRLTPDGDLEFVAAAHETIPRLLEAVRRLRT